MDTPPVNADQIKHAAATLRAGGLVALPTETVYGLAADADSEAAVRALFAAKGRPADHPVIVHIDGLSDIHLWAREVPQSALMLARAFWPGPLTLVLKRTARAQDFITGGQDTVGLRAPRHPWMRAMLHEFGGALAVPSANSFGRVSPTTAQHVIDDLGTKPRGKIDLILDGGMCAVGIESTVVDLSGDAPALLRPGSITRAQLQNVIRCPVVDAGPLAPRSSGRLEKHYAPRTPLEVLPAEKLAAMLATGGRQQFAVLAPLDLLRNCRADVIVAIAAAEDADEYARLLYANLHRLDQSGADVIAIAAPPSGPQWDAVHDRLRRAAARPTGKFSSEKQSDYYSATLEGAPRERAK